MKYTLALCALIFAISNAHGNKEGLMEFGVDDYQSSESKWQIDIAANFIEYPTSLPNYNGEHFKNEGEENYEVYGPSLAFGRDFFLVGNFSSSIKLGVFYYRTFESEKGKASKEIDFELAQERTEHLIYGGGGTISLNYLFEGKSIDTQPFLLFGLGTGQTSIEREYNYDGLNEDNSDREYYEMEVKDSFNYRELGLGINFISKRGIVTSFKVAQSTISISDHELTGKMLKSGGEVITVSEKGKNSDEYNVRTGSIAIGFLF